MKLILPAAFALTLAAQTRAPVPDSAPRSSPELETRMAQLIESTAAANPELVRAASPLREAAQATAVALQRAPHNTALVYRFLNQVKAYLALSDAIGTPEGFPEAAERQYSELREDVPQLQQQLEALLNLEVSGAQAQQADPSNLKRYAEANTKLLPPGKLPRVVFLGDSITDFWPLNEYFTGRDFVNRGIDAQTTLQMLGRFPDDVAGLHPKAVLILAGTNDIGAGISQTAIEDNLTMLGDLAKLRGIKPLFASILPASDYHKDVNPRFARVQNHPTATIQQVNKWIQDYCRREGFIYVDYFSAMVDTTGQMQADLSDDGLHPNSKGYRVMSPIALEAIGRALAGTDQNPAEETPRRRFRLLSK